MRLDREQMVRGKSLAILSQFVSDIKNGDYSVLQKIYECAGIKNTDLVPMLYSNRMLATNIEQQIYIDIAYVLKDRILVSEELGAVFVGYYKKRYPDVYNIYQEITELYVQDRYSNRKFFKTIEHGISFYKYLIYNSSILSDADDYIFSIDYNQDNNQYIAYFESSEKEFENQQFHNFTFHETSERIISSKLYVRNIERRRNELAEFLHISVEKLAEYIFEKISFSSWKGGDDWHIGEAGKIDLVTRQLLMNHMCSHSWLRELFIKDGISNELLKIDKIIDDYYMSLFVEKYIACIASKRPFHKLTLSRECKSNTVAEDYRAILFACEMDILISMQKMIMEEYYLNFSWEKFAKRGFIERYEIIVNDLKNDICNLKTANSLLIEENSVLKAKHMLSESNVSRAYSKEIERLLKKCNGQIVEIESLKDKLSIYEEFDKYNNLETTYQTEDTNDCNLEILSAKRYLFVGNLFTILPNLYRRFPNSLFMDTDRFNLNDIKVDAIVMCTGRMSHSMYYKIKKSNIYKLVPSIMCNSLNENQILEQMYSVMIKYGIID